MSPSQSPRPGQARPATWYYKPQICLPCPTPHHCGADRALGIVERKQIHTGCLLLIPICALPHRGTPGTHSPRFGGPHAAQQFPGRTAEVSYSLRETRHLRGHCSPSEGTAPKTQGGGWSLVGREGGSPTPHTQAPSPKCD